MQVPMTLTENFVNEETGEVLFDAHEFNRMIENTLYRNDILVSKKICQIYSQFKLIFSTLSTLICF